MRDTRTFGDKRAAAQERADHHRREAMNYAVESFDTQVLVNALLAIEARLEQIAIEVRPR